MPDPDVKLSNIGEREDFIQYIKGMIKTRRETNRSGDDWEDQERYNRKVDLASQWIEMQGRLNRYTESYNPFMASNYKGSNVNPIQEGPWLGGSEISAALLSKGTKHCIVVSDAMGRHGNRTGWGLMTHSNEVGINICHKERGA